MTQMAILSTRQSSSTTEKTRLPAGPLSMIALSARRPRAIVAVGSVVFQVAWCETAKSERGQQVLLNFLHHASGAIAAPFIIGAENAVQVVPSKWIVDCPTAQISLGEDAEAAKSSLLGLSFEVATTSKVELAGVCPCAGKS